MGVYTHSEGNWLSRRGGFLVALIGFHLLMFWALKSGFAIKLVEAITEPIKVEIIEEQKIEEPPPPPPTVKIEIPQVQVPPILVDIPNPPDPPPTVILAVTTPDPVPPALSVPPQVSSGPGKAPSVVTNATVTYRPSTEDYYPGKSKDKNEEGVAKIKICYSETGKVTEVSLVESSKYPLLDEAAVRMGKLYKFRAGTIDGKAAAGCANQPIRFSLKNEK